MGLTLNELFMVNNRKQVKTFTKEKANQGLFGSFRGIKLIPNKTSCIKMKEKLRYKKPKTHRDIKSNRVIVD